MKYASQIAALVGEAFEDSPTAYIGTMWWLAFHKETGEVVGFAGMLRSTIEEGTFYLNRAGVVEGHRGHGLQRKLIQARVNMARELGGVACTSDTWDNPHSANNLIAEGFKAYRPKRRWRAEGSMYWKKVL